MTNGRLSSHPERGAVLVHVALAIVALTAFSAFVVDYGVLWASRRQAQNVADSAALAGAVSFGYDSPDITTTGPAYLAAEEMVQSGRVWAQVPAADIILGEIACPPGVLGLCARVNVYRNQAHGNPLPMFFGPLVGLTQQGIRATATARAAAANASDCLKPFAIADKWEENNPIVGGTWTPTSTFDPTGPNPDVYIPQNGINSPGSGFSLANDYGVELTLKYGSPNSTINPGWFQPLDLDGGGGGAAEFRSDIAGCSGVVISIGDLIPKENGNMIGPTKQGIGDLIDLDPNATWDPTANGGQGAVINSCVTNPPCPLGAVYQHSPRIVALPVFDLAEYLDTGGPGNGDVLVTNILGFFVKEMTGQGQQDVTGVLVSKPALIVNGAGGVAGPASFIKSVILIR
jgi:hypothetical protein